MMHKLIGLRNLDIRHCNVKEMPGHMQLKNYRVGKKSGTRIGELRELLPTWWVLHIEELQNVADGRDAL